MFEEMANALILSEEKSPLAISKNWGANNGFSMAEFLWDTPYLPTSLSDFIVELLSKNLISL